MSRPQLTMGDLIAAYNEALHDPGETLDDCIIEVQDEDGAVLKANAFEFLNGQLWIIVEPPPDYDTTEEERTP